MSGQEQGSPDQDGGNVFSLRAGEGNTCAEVITPYDYENRGLFRRASKRL